MYRRVVLKLSGQALAGDGGYGIDPDALSYIAGEFLSVRDLGVEIGVVVGGGNILRGNVLSRLGMDRVTSDHMGMLATLLNALALQDVLRRAGIEAVVQSAIPVGGIAEPFHRGRAVQHLGEGKVVVFAGGTGNPFFTTDTAAALRAAEVGADVVFKGTHMADGVYDRDPAKYPNARRFDRLTYREVLRRGLEVMDWTAISFCMERGLPIVVFRIGTAGNFRRAVMGEAVGTLITN